MKIHELCLDCILDGKELIFVWGRGHAGVRDDTAAGPAAKDTRKWGQLRQVHPMLSFKTSFQRLSL